MLARTLARPRRQNSNKADAEKRCPRFLQWIRGRVCVLATKKGHVCSGKVEAAHVDYAGDKGMGTKVSDRFAIPLCSGAHLEQHGIGWTNFESLWRFNALELANDLWKTWTTQTSMGVIWTKRQAEERQ